MYNDMQRYLTGRFSKTPYSSTPCVIHFNKPYLNRCCRQVLLQSQTACWHSWRRLASLRPPSWVPPPSSGLRKSRSIRRCLVVIDRHIHQRHTPVEKHNLSYGDRTQYISNTILMLRNVGTFKLFWSVFNCTLDISVDDTIWSWNEACRPSQTRTTVYPFILRFWYWCNDKGIVTDTRTCTNPEESTALVTKQTIVPYFLLRKWTKQTRSRQVDDKWPFTGNSTSNWVCIINNITSDCVSG